MKFDFKGHVVFWISLITFVISLNAHANLYPKDIKFQHILKDHEIVLGEVRTIIQDSQGFIWIGGWNGVARYDGYDVVRISVTEFEDGKKVLQPSTETTILYEDKNKVIWVGTGRGLKHYDMQKNLLTVVKNNTDQAVDISKAHVNGILETDNGDILVATRSGLIILNPATEKYNTIVHNPEKPNSKNFPSSMSLPCIFQEPNGQIWLCAENGLNKYDHASRTFTHLVPEPDTEYNNGNLIKKIARTKDGTLWLATEIGLIRYDAETGAAKRYKYQEGVLNGLNRDYIWEVLVDSKDRIWLASEGGGVYLYNSEKDHFLNYQPDDSKESSLGSFVARALMEDNNGDIWIGFYPEGVDFFDQSSTAILAHTANPTDPKSISNNSVLSISEDENGDLWLGTDGGGLSFFDRDKHEFTNYLYDQNDPNSPGSLAVLTTYFDSNGILWLGQWGAGVTRYDIDTNTFTHLPIKNFDVKLASNKELNSRHVWSIFEDSNKEFWIGTHDGGLSKYDRDTKTFRHFMPDKKDPDSISSSWIWFTFEDSKNNFWVGTQDGLNLMDREKGTFKKYFHDSKDPTTIAGSSTVAMYEDSKGRLWVATAYGLSLYDRESETFSHVTTKDGLNDHSIKSIVEDEDGRLWLATSNGMSSYNPETGRVKNYNRDSGVLVGGFNVGAGIMSKKKEAIFGGINGLRIYQVENLKDNKKIPPIAFTQLQIYADVIDVDGEDGILKKQLNFTEEITLDYTKGMFVIDFVALNFRDPSKNQYAYKLEGFDDEWLYVGDARSAKYTNLNPGTYNFLVKGSNNDGVWNEEGRSLTIIQLPPWWKTWWAYTIYLMALAAAIFWIALQQQRKRKRLEELNKVLETRVAERTVELSKKNKDIQAMLSNMRQGLFTVDKTEAIHPEYSRFLEEIFETNKVANENYLDFLFSRAQLSDEVRNQIRAASQAILGEDEFGFDMNSHLLCKEYPAMINDSIRYLSLDWSPIVVDDEVEKLMISVRDVTELKEAERQASAQQRELDLIGQLVYIDTEKFNAFASSVKKYLQENRNIVSSNEVLAPELIATMFRNLHTIKGNARTYGFSLISEKAHSVESTYTELKSQNNQDWDTEKLLDDLNLLNQVLDEYSDVFYRVLGRSKGNKKDRGNNRTSGKLQDVLSDVIRSIPSLARQLNKHNPEVTIDSDNVFIASPADMLLNSIFSHILRNSIDHGIEHPEERVAKGKDATGSINISSKEASGKLEIRIKDDGQGLNINKLFALGKKANKWDDSSRPEPEKIAQLIFESGVSTSDSVTDISGRGVGMDAVKQYLLEIGGDVKLILLDNERQEKKYTHFETVITLPKSCFKASKTNKHDSQEGA